MRNKLLALSKRCEPEKRFRNLKSLFKQKPRHCRTAAVKVSMLKAMSIKTLTEAPVYTLATFGVLGNSQGHDQNR